MARLEEMGLQPKRSLGQNFLVSEGAVFKILSTLPADPSIPVVEIGPGPGALTEGLLKRGFQPTLIELDSRAAAYWRSRGLMVLEDDALKVNFDQFPKESFLISNLPYQISASLVLDLSTTTETFSEMTLMFQKEVAQRLSSEPKNSSYGLLSVVAQIFWDVRKVMDLAPKAFYPAPKVASRVLKFRRLPHKMEMKERASFLRFVKACFHQKRKKLANNLKGIMESDKLVQILSYLETQGFGAHVRAEEIAPEDFVAIYRLSRHESCS